MASKSTKASAKKNITESEGTKKSTGPSLKNEDKLQKECEDLRERLRVASAQVAYLRENLDPQAAEMTSQDANHLYDEALRSAEEIINRQKHELEELKRIKQSQEKEMAGKKGNEKDGSKDGENATLKAEIENLKEQIKELTTKLSDAERNNRQEIVQLESKIEILKKGRDNLKEKLIHINRKIPQFFSQRPVKGTAPAVPDSSTVVGVQKAAGDPNISELSDENRPTKLAENFSEIYDNEWTDAYEDAENEGLDERKAIQKLLGILMDVDGGCRSMANEFKNNIKRAALSLSENGSNVKETKIDVTRNNLLKEIQKSFAPLLVEDVYRNLVKKNKLKLPKNTERFYRSCMELCWLMSVQDPPVVFDTPKTGGKFDSDRYRTYTKMGKQLDYVVWPPMLLHAGGPLLAKGVAQGK
ncbi:uncharacterized protein LOC128239165 isoform X2 [Mya arenaria]|uniref:uncharacterized protein LOC128239165 isoform X2 n=1 Tax=Mya arenaria TaxID=6604 RepID=UPI0022E28724|nr:uncharacterized protein LOC128239165 isoform X2 [Mya arenaria]